MPALPRNLAMALAGYVLAVLVAAFFCLLVIFGADVISAPLRARPRLLQDFLSAYTFGLVLTGMTAWPGFIATLAVSRWRGYRTRAYFAACGAATAILAVVLFAAFERDSSFAKEFLVQTPAIYAGGLAGGFAYALFARRFRVFA